MAMPVIDENGGELCDPPIDATDLVLPVSDTSGRQSSHSDYSSASQSSDENSPKRRERPEPPKTSERDELLLKVWTNRAFCEALGRPDREVRISELSRNNLVLIRVSERATHVLMRATTGTIIEPLWCPLRFEKTAVEACKKFRAGYPQDLKAHLEGRYHGLPNVQLNFHCPCPAQCNNGASCDAVEFDPWGTVLGCHIRDKHPVYYTEMLEALFNRFDTETGPKHREFIRSNKNMIFPKWTSDLTVLWPSQIIPDKIIFPAVIRDNTSLNSEGCKVVHYLCNIAPCAGNEIKGARELHGHLLAEHRIFFKTPTDFYHGCPAAAQDCKVETRARDRQMEAHIKAVHPQLLGLTAQYPPAAEQERARLECMAVEEAECVGESISRGVDTEDAATNDPFLYDYHCPVGKCQVNYSQRDYIFWHIGADHEKDWNPAV
ncbi:uncharacterized protein LOC129583263 isoform X2 [Paramacrobiotus metropolitanus]|uniref:uncharacterized protein LOC129583263 isoform X2 n=1 Tax=Paramacrobiotus metropolitanus TaxID=2943436 RepID=UPI0024458802|nr:uncharacterized protein LOC129583263 isoform X2 [Paramacrobiotus metropolitanus]